MVRRRDGSGIELRKPPIVEVPCTAGKPRNYHARKKKPAASSLQTAHAHTTQQHTAPQGTPSSSHQPPPTVMASTPPAVAGAAGTTGIISRPHIPITGWCARLMAWVLEYYLIPETFNAVPFRFIYLPGMNLVGRSIDGRDHE
ncbi:hypothetical protein DEU56DRAFT_901903 [Suillus clintonianus]|uniref:uncharacterized protein n=1 Tax=Suillus clintonianus TaxID=1904413 RepID=UPI001B874B7D|nr:uncharacterized protein DEU56DRAFT_901903 [Suillus clintonianus]KAG2135171.1 hypothetical protein DEU56DRAFT_901903 [Suillus clintonianus]